MGCASSVSCSVPASVPTLSTLDEYEIGKVIGKGAFSICRSAVHRTSYERVAIKTVDKSTPAYDQTMVRTEMDVLQQIHHPACVKLLSLFESMDSIHMIMERAFGGTLQDRIDEGPLKENVAAAITCQILDGLAHLHSLGICHRDVKPVNILMHTNNSESSRYDLIKLADYGLAAQGAGDYADCMDSVCGTAMYAAPEMLKIAAENSDGKYSCKVDVWSAGCTAYAMLCGKSPFYKFVGKTVQMVTSIIAGDFCFEEKSWSNVSFKAKDVVSSLMQLQPALRPTATKARANARVWNSAAQRQEKVVAHGLLRSPSSESEVSFASTTVGDDVYEKNQKSRSDFSVSQALVTSVVMLEDSLHQRSDESDLFVLSRNES
mmetsp:Transcript_63174/g.131380  ORF Transcript_63174/g.131380 Transcript_63174/m.131380 type:complete len:376 (+) Transcript_63174:18-1145(+)